MKKLMIALLLMSNTALAQTNLEKYWKEFYPGQKCVLIQAFDFYITKALGQNLYEMHTPRSRGARNTVLKMSTRGFGKGGEVMGFKIKYAGHAPIKNTDGFEVEYDLVEECGSKE